MKNKIIDLFYFLKNNFLRIISSAFIIVQMEIKYNTFFKKKCG